MKKDDLLKYFFNQKNVKVFTLHKEVDCCSLYSQLMEEFKCSYDNIYENHFIVSGDYLVTDDNIGLQPDFLLLYPQGNMLFFTLIE